MPSSIPFPLGNSCHNCRNIPSSSLCPADGNLGVRKSISAFQSHIPLQMQGTNSNFHANSSEAFRESPAAFAAGGSCVPCPRPGCTRWRIPPIEQINLQIPAPVLNFLRCKKFKTVPGAGTLPVRGTGGLAAPGRRRPPPVRTRIRVGRCRIRRHRPAAEPECAAL